MERKFLKAESLKFGWEALKKNIPVILVISLIYCLLVYPYMYFSMTDKYAGTTILLLFCILISPIYYKISLLFADNKQIQLKELLGTLRLLLKFLGVCILSALITEFGFVLLVIPGIIWTFMFMFAPLTVIDLGVGPISALKLSSRITKGHKWNLFLMVLIIFLIHIPLVLLVIVICIAHGSDNDIWSNLWYLNLIYFSNGASMSISTVIRASFMLNTLLATTRWSG